jgi:hypothetical protein
MAAKCYCKKRKDVRVIQFTDKRKTPQARIREITRSKCGQKGHLSKECKQQRNFRERRTGASQQSNPPL